MQQNSNPLGSFSKVPGHPLSDQRIEWRRLGAEAVAIVLSILLAFGLEAWWSWSQDRREEQEILAQLAVEFEANQAESVRTWRNHELARSGLEELIGLSAETASQLDPLHIDNLVRQSTIAPHYNPSRGALQATIASGDIELIRDDELRNLLAGWDGALGDIEFDEQSARDFVFHELTPALALYTADPAQDQPLDLVGLFGDRRLRGLLSSRMGFVAHMQDHHADLQQHIDSVLFALREALR